MTSPATRQRPANRPLTRKQQLQARLPRQRFSGTKYDLIRAGSEVEALQYQRASADAGGHEKSVDDQEVINRGRIADFDWTAVGSYTDNAKSGFRKDVRRKDFEKLRAAIDSGTGDVLVVWELSRSQRDLAVYTSIRDQCMEAGLWFWMVGSTVYDLRDGNDVNSLNFQAAMHEGNSRSTSSSVRRGIGTSAGNGNPHGIIPFGYRRTYDSRRRFQGQVFDDEPQRLPNGSTWSPYAVVKQMFADALAGKALLKIADDLNARGIPTARQYAAATRNTMKGTEYWSEVVWHAPVVRRMLLNEAYIGDRVHHGNVTAEGAWPAIVILEDFQKLEADLLREERKTVQPSRAKTLLTCIAQCAFCGDDIIVLAAKQLPDGSWRGNRAEHTYRCRRGHANITVRSLDEYITSIALKRLTAADTWSQIRQLESDSTSHLSEAQATIERLTQSILDLEVQVEDPLSVIDMELASRRLHAWRAEIARIRDTVEIREAPEEVKRFAGSNLIEAASIWAGLGLDSRRKLIRFLFPAPICVLPVGKGRRYVEAADRIVFGRPEQVKRNPSRHKDEEAIKAMPLDWGQKWVKQVTSIYPHTWSPPVSDPGGLVDLAGNVLQYSSSPGGIVARAAIHTPHCRWVRADGTSTGGRTWIRVEDPTRAFVAKLKPKPCAHCKPAISDVQLAET